MAKEEGPPIASGVEAANESLSLPQDPWYFSSPLFPVVPSDLSPPNAPSQWNRRGEAPSLETAWVPVASGVMDLCLQRKELLPAPMQFLCPSGLINVWSDWLDKEIEDDGFCQSLRDANIFEAVLMSRGWHVFRDIIALRYLIHR
nr:hypothetical protein CFP56_76937 [Quercus suber]